MRVSPAQVETCERFGVTADPPRPASMVGIATNTAGPLEPLHALRHAPEGQSNGWYVWRGGGIPQDDPDFFLPIHVEHLSDHAPDLVPYLALPPGWRVMLGRGHEDVWYDPTLLDV